MRRMVRALGLPGSVGCGLLIASLLLWRFDLGPLQARERLLQERVERQSRAAPASGATAVAVAASARARLDGFYAYFAGSGRATDALATLYALGKHLELNPNRAEYRLEPLRDSPLWAYTVTLPVAGSYAAIRTYVEHALHQLPQASLDAARFERKSGGGAIEATLTFTILLARP